MTASAPRVRISSGPIVGTRTDGSEAFLGIPYAAPPVGDLRWAPPRPAPGWTAPRPCTDFGPDSAQAPSFESIRTTPSEDSLLVNVWRPVGTAPGDRRPVLVWIHGGGFLGGGSSIPWYDGGALAARGLVVVSLNYRLGRIGFFAHPALRHAAGAGAGNFGFLDQLAALSWVREEIAAFGGDPGSVTLAGQSAGGASVLALLTSPAADGLFHRVLVMSGGGRGGLAMRQMTGGSRRRPSADRIDAAFAASLGVRGDGPDALARLRALPWEAVQGDFNLESLEVAVRRGRGYGGTPVIGGALAEDHPGVLLARGQAAAVPVVIGTTAVDLPLFLPRPRLRPLAWFGPDVAAAARAYGRRRLLPNRDELVRLHARVGADRTMHEPARFVARTMRALGNRTWLFRFSYVEAVSRGDVPAQVHAGELPFVFDRLRERFGADVVTDEDRAVAGVVAGYVAQYARTGDPNGPGLPEWPVFDPETHDLLDIGLDGAAVFGPDPIADRVALVERAVGRMASRARAARGRGHRTRVADGAERPAEKPERREEQEAEPAG